MKVPLKISWHLPVIIFLIGFLSGVIFGQWKARQDFSPPFWKGGNRKEQMLKHFNRELHLTPEQKQQVGAIFDAKHPQMMALHEEMRPKFEALRNSTHEEIRKILNEDQQKRFDEMNQKMEERWKKRRESFQPEKPAESTQSTGGSL